MRHAWVVVVWASCAPGVSGDGAESDLSTADQVGADSTPDEPVNTVDTVDTDAPADTGPDTARDAQVGSGGFTRPMAWDQRVDNLALHPDSAAMIAALDERGGWGNGDRFQIDFSFRVLHAEGAASREFTPTGDFYTPDCDHVPVPVPAHGAIEGEDGFACLGDGDCHLIVRDGARLYEMWRADLRGDSFRGGCLAVWELDRDYPDALRGEGCTSADAAGLPITPLLFTADEVAAGEIDHAIRFILPNDRIAHRQYVRPATHATGAASANTLGMPYGVRLRLRADYPIATLPAGAQVIARALQRYGMILADGGQIALTALSDRDSVARWDDLLGPRDLAALAVTDFEVVVFEDGEVFHWTGDCERTP